MMLDQFTRDAIFVITAGSISITNLGLFVLAWRRRNG